MPLCRLKFIIIVTKGFLFFLPTSAMFQNCKELIASVEETGLIVREIRDLEDQVRQSVKSKCF